MQETLEPQQGAEAVEALRKEVQRLQLQIKDQTREQEKIVRDIERAVAKRETVTAKVVPVERL